MTIALAPGIETGGRLLRLALICAMFLALGVATVVQPIAGLVVVGAIYVALRGERMVRDGIMLLLLGNVVLTYGFANVGVQFGSMPLPLTEIILLPLTAWCLLRPSGLKELGLPGVLLAAMLLVATLRLIVDFPRFGSLAARDYTTYLEGLALLVGFWSFKQYGLAWASRLWTAVFATAVFYALLYPWGEQIAAAGPVVGLQQPVPLLGQYNGTGPAIASAFFFCLLTMKRPWSYAMGAFCLGSIALLQARGLYIALPMATVLIVLASGRFKTALPGRLAGAFFMAGALFVLVLPLGLEGRMGPITASFATQQLGTLLGREGAGDGSYEDRLEWIDKAWSDLTASPTTLLVGVGLGPDLTNGAKFQGVEAIRKPHNDYVETLARFGLAGFGIWAAFLASMLVPIWRTARHGLVSAAEHTFLLWVIAALACYLFIATNQPLLAFPYGTIPVFMLFGQALALSRQAAGRTEAPEEPS